MAAHVVVLLNPLDPSRRRRYELADGTPLLDWVDAHEPAPGRAARCVYVDGHEVVDRTYRARSHDEVLVTFAPGWTNVAFYVLEAVIAFAVSYALNKLFAPSAPKASSTPAPSQVYGLTMPRNAARLGQPIPVIYGSVICVPDFAAQPYTLYQNNNQILHALLCVGQGQHDVAELLLGDSSGRQLGTEFVSWQAFQPAEHASTFGLIEGAVGVRENIVTSSSVSSQELLPPNVGGVSLKIGPFETCKAGQRGALLELDYVFPGGLFTMDTSGNLQTCTVTAVVEYTPIDDAGASTGAAVQRTETFTAQINTPQRYTRGFAVPLARYKVSAWRTSNSDLKASTSDHVVWAGMKFQLTPPPAGTVVYGNVTLVAIKLMATNGVSSDAAASIRFRVTRRLAPLGTGTPVATVNPADAFVDVLTANYGGNRPVNGDELDLTELSDARALWVGTNGFNAVFDQPSTVWEALRLAVQCVHAAPVPIGSRMSLIHDGPQAVPTQLFTDANIAAGTMQVTESFDVDGTPVGTRVTYRDPRTFSQVALLTPVDAPDYLTIDLFGCTSSTVAQQMATLAANKRRLQRTALSFQTELEGLCCLPGDRIAVQTAMMDWAQGARVESVNGRRLLLDRNLDWTAGVTHAVQLRDTLGMPHSMVGVTPGAAPNELVLPAEPPFAIVAYDTSLEPTHVAFGVVGQEVSDYTVVKVTPQGVAAVLVEAVNYDPAVWAGAAAHQQLDARQAARELAR